MATLDDYADVPIWFGWKTVMRKRKDGVMVPTKMPIAVDGSPASSTDPSTWTTRDKAETAVTMLGLDGLAFALTTLPDGTRLAGLDSDRCYPPDDDSLAPWAQPIHSLLDGHLSELSPSGAGRHHLFLIEPDKLPEGADDRVDYSKGKRPDRFGFELYLTSGRYFTYTGRDQSGDLQKIDARTVMMLVNSLEEFAPPAGEPPKEHPRRTRHEEEDDHAKAIDILDHMPNPGGDYRQWLMIVGSAWTATGGSDQGLRAVERWTERGGYDSAECSVLWRYFSRRPSRRLDIRHLINEARAFGYEPYPKGQRPKGNGNGRPNGHTRFEEPINDDFDVGRMGSGPRKIAVFRIIEGDVIQWDGVEVPEVDMLIDNMLPLHVAGILAGDGGAGKSLLSQVLCTCVATGFPFCGRRVDRGKAVYITGEDPETVLHNRQARINETLGYTMKQLGGRLYLRSILDDDIFLFSDGRVTGLQHELAEELETMTGVRLLIIDSAAIVYDDDEIKRRPVAKFMIMLNRLARKLMATVLLITHKSRSGGSGAGTFTSGSTGWAAHARCGFDITPATDDDDKGDVILKLVKPNYTAPIDPISLRWNRHGVLEFVPTKPTDQLELAVQRKGEGDEDRALMRVIDSRWNLKSPLMKNSEPKAAQFMAREPHKWSVKKTNGVLSRLALNGWITYLDAGRTRGWKVTDAGKEHMT